MKASGYTLILRQLAIYWVFSSLHKNLIEHLNAEIVLHTITSVPIALEWIKSTFLYIRIKQNPSHYGKDIPAELSKQQLEDKLQGNTHTLH